MVEPTDQEVEEALSFLGMVRGRCACAYCGDPKTEWDHFRAIVVNQLPTGFITEIANLVPACGKCNQSKGNKHWKAWMLGLAKGSPKVRGVRDLEQRIARLENFEKWRVAVKLDYASIVGDELWKKHLMHWKGLLAAMAVAQSHAEELRAAIESHLRPGNKLRASPRIVGA